ncbi:unnamed protein product [Blepharisma stoltei]|uniref:Uncharacterized protein n=1 Tax=Blepharisma stoltei TaxID=1481888 RepID=A0AAU9J4T4_9CILI|nr:unnamed protein product [Blepharisma stoltei]
MLLWVSLSKQEKVKMALFLNQPNWIRLNFSGIYFSKKEITSIYFRWQRYAYSKLYEFSVFRQKIMQCRHQRKSRRNSLWDQKLEKL